MSSNRDQQLEKAIKWASENKDIRAMLLTSSLTNPDAPSDIFSDLDIELVVQDIATMLADDSWLSHFGQVVTKIVESEDAFDGLHAMRMVFYEDYTKIDFKIWSIDKFRETVEQEELYEDWDVGYKILIDKDGLTTGLRPPTGQSILINKPTEAEYKRIFNDYWWDTSYVAKCLWRDNIFYAKFMSEREMRFSYLQPIIEWYIASENNWQVTTNKYGRLFKRFLTPDMWAKVEQTFSDGSIDNNWKALFATNELVRELGLALANRLQYIYPMVLDQKMTRYLQVVRDLKKDADTIA